MAKQAVVVMDMLNDFVTGALGCEMGRDIVPATEALVGAAREKGVPVIFCNDAHLKGIDRELALWGDHALAGTEAAQVIPELGPAEGDYVVPKRRYSGFFQTNLDVLLRELGVDTVILAGLQVHICVQHTACDAFCLGYDVVLATDALAAFTEEDKATGLAYIKTCYGGKMLTTEEIIAAF